MFLLFLFQRFVCKRIDKGHIEPFVHRFQKARFRPKRTDTWRAALVLECSLQPSSEVAEILDSRRQNFVPPSLRILLVVPCEVARERRGPFPPWCLRVIEVTYSANNRSFDLFFWNVGLDEELRRLLVVLYRLAHVGVTVGRECKRPHPCVQRDSSSVCTSHHTDLIPKIACPEKVRDDSGAACHTLALFVHAPAEANVIHLSRDDDAFIKDFPASFQ
mmetsp:Transcript_28417/g.39655  ORF Transcript_28417/g.39655 Transcript_28417/m.39655 type:complete len:218 (+) Transcript_28417:213-866(+)